MDHDIGTFGQWYDILTVRCVEKMAAPEGLFCTLVGGETRSSLTWNVALMWHFESQHFQVCCAAMCIYTYIYVYVCACWFFAPCCWNPLKHEDSTKEPKNHTHTHTNTFSENLQKKTRAKARHFNNNYFITTQFAQLALDFFHPCCHCFPSPSFTHVCSHTWHSPRLRWEAKLYHNQVVSGSHLESLTTTWNCCPLCWLHPCRVGILEVGPLIVLEIVANLGRNVRHVSQKVCGKW